MEGDRNVGSRGRKERKAGTGNIILDVTRITVI
jgi:hypothetical protein